MPDKLQITYYARKLFSENIGAKRRIQNISQEELARLANLHRKRPSH
jgi:hypothetical protein